MSLDLDLMVRWEKEKMGGCYNVIKVKNVVLNGEKRIEDED